MNRYSIFDELGLEFKPVGVKFSMTKPLDLPRLKKSLAMCEMLAECQQNGGFYATVEEHQCAVGPHILGQRPANAAMVSGMLGPHLGVYKDARANRNAYNMMHCFQPGSAPYTWFDTLDHISFDPDLIILLCDPDKAEIVLRAHGYNSGEPWTAFGTTIGGCACLYTYPYFTGKMNMMITGLHHGMRARKTFPMGKIMLSIPFQKIPEIAENLKEMKEKDQWDLPQYHWGKEEHLKYMASMGKKIAEEAELVNSRED